MQILPTGTMPAQTTPSLFVGMATSSSSDATGEAFMQTVSSLTGISQDDLVSQLEGGTSLADILQSKNVTMSQVQQAMQAQASQAVQGPQGAVHGSGHHHHHHSSGEGVAADPASSNAVGDSVLNALAGALNMAPADLTQQLTNGVGLAQLGQQQGVSEDALVTAVQNTLENPAAYSASGSQASSQTIPPQVINTTV
jgi:hypothetical protein